MAIDPKRAAKIIAGMSPTHLELLSKVLDDPKKAMDALELMINGTKNREARTQLLNAKHAIERFILEERKN